MYDLLAMTLGEMSKNEVSVYVCVCVCVWVYVSSMYVLQCEELTAVLCTSFEKEKIQVLTRKLLRPL